MPKINYAEKLIKKEIDNRLKRYHLKIIKACSESPETLNTQFIKKVEILRQDIIDVYGKKSDYVKTCDKLLQNCKICPVAVSKNENIKKDK